MTANQFQLFKRLNHLYWPILGNGIAYGIMPFINTLMMGHLAPEVLAAGGLVNACFAFTMVVYWGIFTTLGTLISRHNTIEYSDKINYLFKSAHVLALMLSIITAIAFSHLALLFKYFHQPQTVIIIAEPYIKIISLLMIPNLMITVNEQLFFGLGKPRVVMCNAIIMLLLNIGLNYTLMYGKLGLPAMGIKGLALGSLITACISACNLLIIITRMAPFKNFIKKSTWLNKEAAFELVTNGLPVGLIWLIEVGFFTIVAFLMGRISVEALAAHELAFQADLLFFCLTINMGQALQIVIGESIGQKQYHDIHANYKIAFLFLTSVLAAVALVVWGFPNAIIHLVLGEGNIANAQVANIAYDLLKLMPIFLLFDSLSFLTLSALRALKKTRVSLLIVVCDYWLVAVPILSLGVLHYHIFGPRDLWLGLCFGALISFILQLLYFNRVSNKYYKPPPQNT